MSTRDRIHADIKSLIDKVVDLTDDTDVVPELQARASRLYRKLDEARTIWLDDADGGPTPEDLKGTVTHDIG